MQLNIHTAQGVLKAGRFSGNTPCLKTEDPITLTNTDNTITIGKQGITTWEQEYEECILSAENRLSAWYDKYAKHWLWSINNIKTTTGEITILPGRLFYINNTIPHTVSISKPHLDNILSLVDQYKILHRFIMCIYHYLNNLHRRLMNPEAPYGIVQRYLSAQACWNLSMFNVNFIVDAFANVDSVNIILGYVNKSCDPVTVDFEVQINASGSGLGLLGVYLDEASSNYDPNEHTIRRNLISSSGKDLGLADITNPNDCQWSWSSSWSKAIINQRFTNVERQAKCVYTITRNLFTTGYIRYSKDAQCSFDITVLATASTGDSRIYNFKVSCAALVQGRDVEYKTKEDSDE
jgi:hypothetical protein